MYNYFDNLDVIDDELIIIKANIKFLKKEEGGRTEPIPGNFSYRPNHNFGDSNNRLFYIGQINFDKNDLIKPGDIRIVEIIFFNVRGLNDLLHVGLSWRIQEGPVLVATGEVLEIKNQ